jgi:Family of unknown function (DUF6152)
MNCRRLAVVWGAVTALVAAVNVAPASAHHSFSAEFDADKPVTVKGVITSVRLENPHSWFFLDVTTPDGKVEKWSFEASTPSSLIRSGFKPGTVKAGDQVTIRGFHARDANANAGAGRELILADGREIAIGPPVGPGR